MAKFHGISARSRVDALRYAIANSKYDAIRGLIKDGVDLDALGLDGEAALHVAARMGRFKAAEILLSCDVSVNRLDKNGYTPLMTACHNGGTNGSRVAILLINANADVKHVLPNGHTTALTCAMARGTAELIEALLDAGSLTNGPRGCALTPLMAAARANNVDALRILVDRGAKLNRKCKFPWANGATAQGLAEMERRMKAVKFFRNL